MGSACRTGNPPITHPIQTKGFTIHQSDMVRAVEAHVVKHDYNILAALGEGGYGEVKRAIHKITNIPRALKIMNKGVSFNKKDNALMREVDFLREIDHPHALRAVEYYEDDSNFYIVYELMKGGNLYDKWLKGTKFSEARIAEIMRQVLSAVSFIHRKGIVHRDIKMDNILLVTDDSKSTVKLADFGTAVKLNPSKKLTEKKGTLQYMAPEVLKGDIYNEKCDIWSCAVVFYMLLSGQQPFDASNEEGVTKNILRAEVSTSRKGFDKVSEEAKDLLRNMFQADITKRYSAQQCLDHPWFQKMLPEEEIEKSIDHEVMANVAAFTGMSKLKNAFWAFFIAYFSPLEDKVKIINTWNALDRKGRGVLSKDELNKGFEVAFKNQKTVNIDSVFSNLDINNCGRIEFTGFLNAAFDKSSFLNDDRIQQMFKIFDKDEDNIITIEEFKEFLTPNQKFQGTSEHIQLINDMSREFQDQLSFEAFKSTVIKHFGYQSTPSAN